MEILGTTLILILGLTMWRLFRHLEAQQSLHQVFTSRHLEFVERLVEKVMPNEAAVSQLHSYERVAKPSVQSQPFEVPLPFLGEAEAPPPGQPTEYLIPR